MEEFIFKSSLSEQEMKENFAGFDIFDGLMEGLTEALAHSKGKAAADTFSRKRSLPDVNVTEIRTNLNMTQRSFASMLGVSPRTVESWESGRTTPTPTAKKLLFLIREDHRLAQRLMEAQLRIPSFRKRGLTDFVQISQPCFYAISERWMCHFRSQTSEEAHYHCSKEISYARLIESGKNAPLIESPYRKNSSAVIVHSGGTK